MGKNNSTIIINGKSYDSQTGVLLSEANSAKNTLQPSQKPSSTGVVRQPAKHVTSHKTQHSKTLMRHAVEKPNDSLKRRLKAQSGNGAVAKSLKTSIVTKASVHKLNVKRLRHAEEVPKSKLIARFVPITAGPHAATHKPTSIASQQIEAIVKTHNQPPHIKTTADLLQQAIEQATSHEQTYTPAKNRSSSFKRTASIIAVTSAMAVVLIIAVAGQSLVAVRLHVASSKAGFPVSAPSYQPAGYSLSHLTYSAGTAGLHFTSNSDADRAFSITEKTTSWDSNAVRDLVVTPTSKEYQTIEAAGRTIFLNNDNQATWVDKGVLYQLDTRGVLNEQQLVKIANSL